MALAQNSSMTRKSFAASHRWIVPAVVIGGLVLLAVALVGAACWAIDRSWFPPHPSSAELITRFNTHRDDFERLAVMFQQDTDVSRIAPDFTRPEGWAVTNQERYAEYQQLFDRTGLRAGVEGYRVAGHAAKDTIYFYASTQGLSIAGSGKGYLYLTEPPEQTVDDLDRYTEGRAGTFIALQHITGNWYLFYESQD